MRTEFHRWWRLLVSSMGSVLLAWYWFISLNAQHLRTEITTSYKYINICVIYYYFQPLTFALHLCKLHCYLSLKAE